MAEDSSCAGETKADTHSPSHEDVFERLPPLDSREFIQIIETAPVSEIPPEVLVRAFRQLPPTSDASRVVLRRLFNKTGEHWDYFAPLIARARRRSRSYPRDEYRDLLQDAMERILRILPTARGEYAERSWHAFCYREFIEAWRARYGRRGERYPSEDQPECAENEQNYPSVSSSNLAPWHGTVNGSSVQEIEEIAHRVIADLQDPFHRRLAEEAWFRNRAPQISGNSKENDGPPLTSVFEGKSRFQIGRALRYVNAQLSAALLAAPSVELTADVRDLLYDLKTRSKKT